MKVGLNNPHTKSIVLSTKDFSENADAEEEEDEEGGAKYVEYQNVPRAMKRRKMRRRGGKLSQARNTQPAVTALEASKKQSIINEEANDNAGSPGEKA